MHGPVKMAVKIIARFSHIAMQNLALLCWKGLLC